MSGSHGRADLSGRAWLGMALAASGWFAASGPGSAGACHISHNTKPAAEHATPAPAAATPPATSPDADLKAALQTFIKDWNQAVPATPPAITPTLTTTATPPAAQELAPITPTVANQGIAQPCGCPPPPPCTAPPIPPGGTSGATTPSGQDLAPPAGLTNPTPTPEPSTVLSALAMVGAVAWRRRADRARA